MSELQQNQKPPITSTVSQFQKGGRIHAPPSCPPNDDHALA